MEPAALSPSTLDWIRSSVGPGAEILSVQPQGGATSSTLHRVELINRGQPLSLMLRRFTNREWLAEEPGLAEHEAANLQKVRETGIPAPELVAFDPSGERVGVPAVLMTRLSGRVDLLPGDSEGWLRQQAEVLLPLHRLTAAGYPWGYAPYFSAARLSPPEWSGNPGLWEKAIEIANRPPPDSLECFIHRDYHPVNVLWQNGKLSGVVDWPNACRGPVSIDVSWCRRNLAELYGRDCAERFLDIYRSVAGEEGGYHPYWDILCILDGLPDQPKVYPPWLDYGMTGLTPELMLERIEGFLQNILRQF